MARFVRRSDNEPLMRLERPSSASSQTTAHIINSCFNDILSQKPPLDSVTLNNLAVSRRGGSSYHDEFVDGLKQISDEYNQRLNKLAHLEHHVVQARAKALAEDEKVVTGLKKICPSFQEIGLPKGPSNLHKLLDDDLLSEHHLLAPSQYLPQPVTPHQPPTEGPPSYMMQTRTSTLHATVVSKSQEEATSKHSSRPAWKNTLTPAEREADKIALSKLEHRSRYLQNPKYSQSALTSTASSGPLKLKLQQQGTKETAQFFVAEPSEIVFSDYQPGHTYEVGVKLKNISGASRQLRIVPLSSSFFSVTPDQFPNSDGLIAPGMYCSYIARFTPDSLANYEDQLQVLTTNGESLCVPIRAFRPAPELSLPRVLQCGCCLAGDRVSTTIECWNTGGEGNFRLMTDKPTGTLTMGPFSISPSEFHLGAGSNVTFPVEFEPCAVGEHLEDITMACDNGQVLPFTLRGVAGKVDVGCVFTGESYPDEALTLNSGSVHFLLDEDDPLINEIKKGERDSVIQCPSVEFSTVNPHNACHRTVVIKNFSEVNLPFKWGFYRPITRPVQTVSTEKNDDIDGDVPSLNRLVPSKLAVFSVQPSSGILNAGEAKKFTFELHPEKVGSFTDMAHLVLPGIPSDQGLNPTLEGVGWLRLSPTDVSVVYVELSGTSQGYDIEMSPPAVLFPGELPIASETRKRIKIINHSLSDVSYHWDGYEDEAVCISMDPAYGNIASGGSVHSELVIQAHTMGPFNSNLQCHLELCDVAVTLPVEGCIQAPIVKASVANLNFGLVQLGQCSSLRLSVTNFSNCSINCQFTQRVEDDSRDHHCLSVTSADRVRLAAYGSTTVNVECRPKRVGQVSSVLELLVDGKPCKHISVLAEVQQPQVHLDKCQLHIERAYMGIESNHSVVLRNTGLLSTQFTWSSQVYGASSDCCRVRISPMTGRIGPRDTVAVSVDTTWNKMGPHSEAVLRCDVLGTDTPLFLSLSTVVYGLSVTYEVQSTATGSNRLPNKKCTDGLCLDYGCNILGIPTELTVTVTNTSAIPTSLETRVTNFPAAKPPTPPSAPNPGHGEKTLQKRGRYLLQNTASICDPKRKCVQAAATVTDYASSLLRDGRGACFLVSLSSAELPPFSSVTLTITAYSDMWGQYTDQLICTVAGGDDKVIPIHYDVTGCPVVFQATATPLQTLVRFGSHLPNDKVVKRVLKMRNTSPVDLRIDWTVSNLLQNDDKIVDLITFFDDPFPKLSKTFMSAGTAQKVEQGAISSRSVTHSLGKDGGSEESTSSLCDLIKVLIKPHEGVASHHPFDICPRQMVIPARGQCSVTLTFEPSISALNEMGDKLASYALGYFSLDKQDPPNVTRMSGYDVEPLRVDMLASIEHAQLILDCDEDDGLNFNLPASVLVDSDQQIHQCVQVRHGFTVINSSSSLLQFSCSTLTQSFHITGASTEYKHTNDHITLKPQQNFSFGIQFTLSLDDLNEKIRGALPSNNVFTYEDALQIEFSTGAKQIFPLKASVILPRLDISRTAIEFGMCLLEKAVTVNVTLSNTTSASVPWTATVSPELKEVVFLDREGGLLPPYLTGGKPSTQLLQVTFIPSNETHYQGFITLQEQLTREQLTVRIEGCGSADEHYYNQP